MRKYLAAVAVAALALGTAGVAVAQDPPVTSIDQSDQNNDNRCRDASIVANLIQTVTQSQNQTVDTTPSTGDVNQTQGDQAVDAAINQLIDCSVTNNFNNPPANTTVVTLPTGQVVVLPVVLDPGVQVARAPVAVAAAPRFTG